MAIFVARPQVSLTISEGSLKEFPIEDMSKMCFLHMSFYLSRRVKTEELQIFKHC